MMLRVLRRLICCCYAFLRRHDMPALCQRYADMPISLCASAMLTLIALRQPHDCCRHRYLLRYAHLGVITYHSYTAPYVTISAAAIARCCWLRRHITLYYVAYAMLFAIHAIADDIYDAMPLLLLLYATAYASCLPPFAAAVFVTYYAVSVAAAMRFWHSGCHASLPCRYYCRFRF